MCNLRGAIHARVQESYMNLKQDTTNKQMRVTTDQWQEKIEDDWNTHNKKEYCCSVKYYFSNFGIQTYNEKYSKNMPNFWNKDVYWSIWK